jgi:uncharacterized protein (TIGR01777 family)
MKVIIAGGSGLIGTALATALLAAGHEPVILSRHGPRDGNTTNTGGTASIRHATWDPAQPGDWTSELAGAGAVINLGGASIGHWPWTSARKAELVGSRVTATRALVDAIRGLPAADRPKVFLSASGTDLYEGRDATPADETTAPADTFLSQLVLAWEAEATKATELGLRVVLVRTSPVVAPGAASLRIEALPFRLFLGGRLGSGRQWWSWIDGSDIVGIYLWALATDSVAGPINATAPDPRQQADFARALGAVLHRPSWFPAPAFMIRLLLADQATLALGSRRVWPTAALAGGYAFKRPRLEDSLRAALVANATGA